jgi:hypothetical protein
MEFIKEFNTEDYSNTYKTECGTYEIYRERTFKNNGTSKCDGDWIVQKNGQILTSFPTLKRAKLAVTMALMN